jgi:hypothetical protein
MHPLIDSGLTQLKDLSLTGTVGEGLLVAQDEQQLLLRSLHPPLAPTPGFALAEFASPRPHGRVPLVIRAGKGEQQRAELFGSQAGQRPQLPPILLELSVFHHTPRLACFG